jgi:hypothetical protein
VRSCPTVVVRRVNPYLWANVTASSEILTSPLTFFRLIETAGRWRVADQRTDQTIIDAHRPVVERMETGIPKSICGEDKG